MMSGAMSGKVLVTGGSGFLGINIIRHLMSKGITNFRSLDVVDFDYPEKDRVEILKGDIRDTAAVAKAMEGVRWVIHTAAALPLYSEHDIITTDVYERLYHDLKSGQPEAAAQLNEVDADRRPLILPVSVPLNSQFSILPFSPSAPRT